MIAGNTGKGIRKGDRNLKIENKGHFITIVGN